MGITVTARRIDLRLAAAVFALTVLVVIGGIAGVARADDEASGTVFATVIINTIEMVTVSAPPSVAVGEKFQLVAVVRNIGTTRILKASATLHIPVVGDPERFVFSINGKNEKNLGVIKPLGEKSVRWNLVAEESGCQLIQVTATGVEQASGAVLEDQGSVLVRVGVVNCTTPAASPETEPEEPVIKDTVEPLVANEPPIADDQSLETEAGTPVSISLTGIDPGGDALTYTVVTSPTHGTLDGEAPELTYTPDEGFTGEDSFTFTANDGLAESPTATVTITVIAAAETPVPAETPTPESTPEATDTPVPTETPTPEATPEATETPVPTELPTPEPTPEVTETPVPTETPTPEPTPEATETPVPTETPTPEPTPEVTNTPVPTELPTPEPTPKATETPVPTETPTPEATPEATDTPVPTETPTPEPTPEATETPVPTETPTPEPTP